MTQERAIEILKTGGNVFLTGEPGTGKTYVINEYIAWLETAGIGVAVTASTGIAATHIGGMTIHAWSGIGIRDSLSAYDLDAIASKEKIAKRVQRARVLVIDEISMLDGSVLDMVDRVCRTIRKTNEAFGGLQVIFVGDFFQLPPIVKAGDTLRYAFESKAWDDARPLVCYLVDQFRQDDELLTGLLTSIRRNEIDEAHYTLLQEQTEIAFPDVEPTRLYTHNADVDQVNSQKLSELSGKSVTFKMEGRGNKQLLPGLVKSCLSPEDLLLKEEAMVMCTKNNFEAGYVNGTLGRIVRFDADDGYPVIKTADGRELKVAPTSWSMSEEGKVLAEIVQVPLRLAWAITIHKSQGMSLDAAEIDLSRAFVFGQGYVALSRVRTLDGLKMLGMNPNALTVDPKIVHKNASFEEQSNIADRTFNEMEEREIIQMHTAFVLACGGTFPVGDIPSRGMYSTRVKKESTTAETKRLLADKLSIETIAKQRKMVTSTIWSHIEQLIEVGELTVRDIDHLLPANWDRVWHELQQAIDEVGYEKLKPIYEYAKEKYEYPTIRLARAYYLLLERSQKQATNV